MLMIVAAIAVVAVIAAVVIISSIDINSRKPQIEKAVSDALGLQVKIGSPMRISYFPFGMTAGDIHLGNKSGEILSVEKLRIGLDLIPLLKRQIKVRRCELIRPAFTIVRDESGKFNFEGEKKAAPGPAEALGMNEIKLTRGSLIYSDQKTGERTEIEDLNFVLKNVSIEDISGDLIKGTSFEGSLNYKHFRQRQLWIEEFSAEVRADRGRFDFKPLTIASIITTSGKTKSKTELHNVNADLKGLSIADTSGDVLRSASLEGSLECKEVLRTGLRMERIKAVVSADKGVYDFKPLTIGSVTVSEKKSSDKTELREIRIDAKGLSISDAPGDLIKNISFTGKAECKGVRKGELRIDNVAGPLKADKGVYHLQPFTADILGGRGQGDVTADLSGAKDSYKLNLKLSAMDFEKLTEAFGKKKVIGGKGDIVAAVSFIVEPGRDFLRSLDGEFQLHGVSLVLYSMDLDRVLDRFKETQNFNLIDLGAFFIAGPLGTAATKGLGYGSLYVGARGGQSTIRELVSDWKIKKGIADSSDCALSTHRYRVALKGKLDLVRERYDDVIVAILNKKGCADFSQKVNGPFGNPQIGAISTLQSIAGPVFSLFSKAKGLIEGGRCEVFYKGKVLNPS